MLSEDQGKKQVNSAVRFVTPNVLWSSLWRPFALAHYYIIDGGQSFTFD